MSQKEIEKLIGICERSGVVVEEIDYGNSYYSYNYLENNKNSTVYNEKIRYNKHLTKQNKLYFFLHEMGHRELVINGIDLPENKIFNKSFHTLAEEISAWEKGLEIAKKYKIEINEKGYQRFACKALRTYIALFFTNKQEVRYIKNALAKYV